VDFRTIIVSSLGTISNSTILNLSAIIGNKIKVIMNLWAKRLVISGLKGSFKIWLKGGNQLFYLMEPQKKYSMKELESKDTELEINR
jgi:hypothetical protein